MNSDISYDPVSVIDEKEAIGETAKIFKDIRETMNIPLITSIWRGLAEIDDSLKKISSMVISNLKKGCFWDIKRFLIDFFLLYFYLH